MLQCCCGISTVLPPGIEWSVCVSQAQSDRLSECVNSRIYYRDWLSHSLFAPFMDFYRDGSTIALAIRSVDPFRRLMALIKRRELIMP